MKSRRAESHDLIVAMGFLAACLAPGCDPASTDPDARPASMDASSLPTGDAGGPRSDAGGRDAAMSPLDAMSLSDGGSGSGGGAEFRGRVLLFEPFEDTDYGARGWYDTSGGAISAVEHIDGSAGSFECRFVAGASTCEGGLPGRFQFEEVESVYLSYWLKYSANYVGSGRDYHPHELFFMTNLDGRYAGPSHSHLTAYVEHNGGRTLLGIQDASNVDLGCVLLNDDSFVGCGGSFDTYVFTEARSAAACNGLQGDLDVRDCFPHEDGYYSWRSWRAPEQVFRDEPGPGYKNDWHFVEAYFRLNSISGGVGAVDGSIRYWMDGRELIASDRILIRTGQHPEMRFDKLLVAPYIGDGSPVTQSMWIDDLTIAEGAR